MCMHLIFSFFFLFFWFFFERQNVCMIPPHTNCCPFCYFFLCVYVFFLFLFICGKWTQKQKIYKKNWKKNKQNHFTFDYRNNNDDSLLGLGETGALLVGVGGTLAVVGIFVVFYCCLCKKRNRKTTNTPGGAMFIYF